MSREDILTNDLKKSFERVDVKKQPGYILISEKEIKNKLRHTSDLPEPFNGFYLLTQGVALKYPYPEDAWHGSAPRRNHYYANILFSDNFIEQIYVYRYDKKNIFVLTS